MNCGKQCHSFPAVFSSGGLIKVPGTRLLFQFGVVGSFRDS